MIAYMAAHAHDILGRATTCMVAIGTSAAGLWAQADPTTGTGHVGEIGVYAGITYLIIAVIREGSPPLQKLIETLATARNERVKLETELGHLTALHHADAARIATLETRLSDAETAARDAMNLLENARIEVEARTRAIEGKAREANHTARNNAQRIQNLEQAVGSGSDDRDPESAI